MKCRKLIILIMVSIFAMLISACSRELMIEASLFESESDAEGKEEDYSEASLAKPWKSHKAIAASDIECTMCRATVKN